MRNLPNRAPENRNLPLPPVRSSGMRGMVSSRHEIGSLAGRNHPSVAFIKNGGPSMAPRTTVATTHSLQQSHHGHGTMYREHLTERQEQSVHPNMHSSMPVVHDPPPPGMFPHDLNAPRRPPMITEEAIKDYKEQTMGARIQPDGSVKDIHRHLRVVHVIGKFVQEHNQLNNEDTYMQYRWYGTDKNDRKITTTLLAIVEDSAHALIPHLYSKFTYNDAQRKDCASMEALVARVASHELFDPLTQTLRSFGIRKLIQEKMATKKKTRDRQKKREGQNILQNDVASNATVSLGPYSNEATLTVPDLPSEAYPRSDTLDPLVTKQFVNDEPIRALPCRADDQTERTGPCSKETGGERTVVPTEPNEIPLEAVEQCIEEGVTYQLSKDCKDSAGKSRAKGKKNKAKKAASKLTLHASAQNVQEVAVSDRKLETSEHRNTIAQHCSQKESAVIPSKSRKRKRTTKESAGSESTPSHIDSDDYETELADLKKRMKEIEKRKTKKKGKKKRTRQ